LTEDTEGEDFNILLAKKKRGRLALVQERKWGGGGGLAAETEGGLGALGLAFFFLGPGRCSRGRCAGKGKQNGVSASGGIYKDRG